jgi:hypothetical protein
MASTRNTTTPSRVVAPVVTPIVPPVVPAPVTAPGINSVPASTSVNGGRVVENTRLPDSGLGRVIAPVVDSNLMVYMAAVGVSEDQVQNIGLSALNKFATDCGVYSQLKAINSASTITSVSQGVAASLAFFKNPSKYVGAQFVAAIAAVVANSKFSNYTLPEKVFLQFCNVKYFSLVPCYDYAPNRSQIAAGNMTSIEYAQLYPNEVHIVPSDQMRSFVDKTAEIIASGKAKKTGFIPLVSNDNSFGSVGSGSNLGGTIPIDLGIGSPVIGKPIQSKSNLIFWLIISFLTLYILIKR